MPTLVKCFKYRRLLFSLFVLLFTFVDISAQNERLEVFSTAGEHVQKANHQLSYTVGETVTITQGNRYFFVTQGFHQVEWSAVLVWEYTSEAINLEVFPNPYSRNLNIVIPKNFESEVFQYRVFDLTFKLVTEGDLDQIKNTLEIPFLPSGTYLLNITKNKELMKTFRIIKTQ